MFTLSTGVLSPDPEGRPLAARLGKRRYATATMCEKCKRFQTRNTASARCIHCMTLVTELVRYLLSNNESSLAVTPLPDYLEGIEPTWDAIEAYKKMREDPSFKLHTSPCKAYGHVRITNEKHDKCYICDMNSNAQEQAVKEGNDEYVTRSKCGGCGETTLRRTKDASCTECDYTPQNGRGRTSDNATTIMMRENPDMVISKEDADSLDIKVFRTGKPCSRGHTGWRYVSTGNCIDCRKGND